jgi:hypothetical protein
MVFPQAVLRATVVLVLVPIFHLDGSPGTPAA